MEILYIETSVIEKPSFKEGFLIRVKLKVVHHYASILLKLNFIEKYLTKLEKKY